MATYAALYRAWRPRRLADVVGQEHVTRTLLNALRQGHVGHAYLFCGPRGTGKTSTARILAAALNCEHPDDGDACGRCERCREVATDRLVDVQEIDAASHRQVEDVRALRETVGYAPAAGRHKVYILDEVHMLTDASWNTLLKTLEEPPPATSFVLCTTDPRKVLPTVVSRCQRFDFRRLANDQIVARLQEVCDAEGIGASAAALTAIAKRSDGGLRDALSMLDQATAYVAQGEISAADIARIVGAADDDAIELLLGAAEQGDARTLLATIEGLYADGRDMAEVTRDLVGALRNRLGALVEDGQSRRARLPWHLRAIELLAEAEGSMRRWSQPRLVLEVALLMACGREEESNHPTPAAEHPAAQSGSSPSHHESVAGGTPSGRAGAGPSGPSTTPTEPDDGTGGVRQGRRAEDALTPITERIPNREAAATSASSTAPSWENVLQVIAVDQPAKLVGLTEARFAGVVDGVLTLVVPESVLALAAQRQTVVQEAWHRLGGPPIRVEFIGGGAPPRAGRERPAPRSTAAGAGIISRGDSLRKGKPPAPAADEPPPPPEDEPRATAEQRVESAAGPSPGVAAMTPHGPDRHVADKADVAFRRALNLFNGTPLTRSASGER